MNTPALPLGNSPTVRLVVLGTPAPKGSARAMNIKGRAFLVPGGSSVNRRNMKAWDTAVREAARDAVGSISVPPFVGVALQVAILFRLARPAGHWGTKGLKPSAPRYPATKPDLDKLTRATGDSLTGIVFDDDSRIVILALKKIYADPGQEGATIEISAVA